MFLKMFLVWLRFLLALFCTCTKRAKQINQTKPNQKEAGFRKAYDLVFNKKAVLKSAVAPAGMLNRMFTTYFPSTLHT